jgi:hypothetical protein
VDEVERDLREIEAVEAVYRKRLSEAKASGDEHSERVAALTLERCKLIKDVRRTPAGIAQSSFKLRECDLAIEMFQMQIAWCHSHGEDIGADLKRQALQRTMAQRAEAESLLEMQKAAKTVSP